MTISLSIFYEASVQIIIILITTIIIMIITETMIITIINIIIMVVIVVTAVRIMMIMKTLQHYHHNHQINCYVLLTQMSGSVSQLMTTLGESVLLYFVVLCTDAVSVVIFTLHWRNRYSLVFAFRCCAFALFFFNLILCGLLLNGNNRRTPDTCHRISRVSFSAGLMLFPRWSIWTLSRSLHSSFLSPAHDSVIELNIKSITPTVPIVRHGTGIGTA